MEKVLGAIWVGFSNCQNCKINDKMKINLISYIMILSFVLLLNIHDFGFHCYQHAVWPLGPGLHSSRYWSSRECILGPMGLCLGTVGAHWHTGGWERRGHCPPLGGPWGLKDPYTTNPIGPQQCPSEAP